MGVRKMENKEIIHGIKAKDLKNLQNYTEKAFGKIFEGREKAKQRLIYDSLNHIKTNDRDSFLNQLLKILNAKSDEKDINKLVELINMLYVEYDTPENFQKIAYAIIMGIMAAKKGGE